MMKEERRNASLFVDKKARLIECFWNTSMCRLFLHKNKIKKKKDLSMQYNLTRATALYQ